MPGPSVPSGFPSRSPLSSLRKPGSIAPLRCRLNCGSRLSPGLRFRADGQKRETSAGPRRIRQARPRRGADVVVRRIAREPGAAVPPDRGAAKRAEACSMPAAAPAGCSRIWPPRCRIATRSGSTPTVSPASGPRPRADARSAPARSTRCPLPMGRSARSSAPTCCAMHGVDERAALAQFHRCSRE